VSEVEPSEEEIRRFMQKYYPEYAGNLELGRILYKRFMKKKYGRKGGGGRYARKNIGDISARERVEVEGVIADVYREYEYVGCAVCRRKNCNNPRHRGRRTYVVKSFVLGDNTGTVHVSYIVPKEENGSEIEVGCKVVVRGYVKNYRGNNEIVADSVEVKKKVNIRDVQNDSVEGEEADEPSSSSEPVHEDTEDTDKKSRIDDLLSALGVFGKLKKELFPVVLDRYGLSWDDVKPYVEVVEEGGEEWVVVKKQ